MDKGIQPYIGEVTTTKKFEVGFLRLCIISLSGNTTVTVPANNSTLNLPVGLPMYFEMPQNQPHSELTVGTTGKFLYLEYR